MTPPGGLQMPPLQKSLALPKPRHRAIAAHLPTPDGCQMRWVAVCTVPRLGQGQVLLQRRLHNREGEMHKHHPPNNSLCQPEMAVGSARWKEGRSALPGETWGMNRVRCQAGLESGVSRYLDGPARALSDAAERGPRAMVPMRLESKAGQIPKGSVDTP